MEKRQERRIREQGGYKTQVARIQVLHSAGLQSGEKENKRFN
ncbi:MAG: hypothetical protein RLZZ429_2352 [Bacteroidota bacterium]